MAAQFLKIEEKDDKPLSVIGGEGGQVKPKQKWPVTQVTLAGLNNKDLAKDLWSSVDNGSDASGVNDFNFAAAVSMAMGGSTKVVVGDKTYWFAKKKAAESFEQEFGDADDSSTADSKYDSNGFVKKVSDIFNEIR